MWATNPSVGLSELNADELKTRIEAARALRNIEQIDLDDLFAGDGLGKSAGRLERGKLALTRALLDGLVRHLRVPERWFTTRDIDPLFYGESESSRLEVELAGMRASMDRMLRTVEERPDLKQEIQEAFEDYARRLAPEIGKLPRRSKRNQDRPAEEPPAAA